MNIWKKWTLLVCFSVASLGLADGRKVAAMDDICSRGAYSFCQNRNQLPVVSPSRDLPQPSSNNGAARSPFSATPPPLPTVGDYCRKYRDHFSYYCAGTVAKDAKAGDFCPTYTSYCDTSSIRSPGGSQPARTASTPLPELPPAKIQQICTDYQPVANQYCFRPEITQEWHAKQNCDIYLKYCVATATDQLQQQNKTLKDVLKENIKPCAKFQNDYIGFCVQNPKPYNDQVADFCRNYKGICVPVGVPTAGAMAGAADVPQPQSQIQQIQQNQMQQAMLNQQLQQTAQGQLAQTAMLPQAAQGQLAQTAMIPQAAEAQLAQTAMLPQAAQGQLAQTAMLPQAAQGQLAQTAQLPQQAQMQQQMQQAQLQQMAQAQLTGAQQAQNQGRPITPQISPTPLGNPDAITNPLGSLGNPGFLGSGAASQPSPSFMNTNPGTSMIRGLQGNPQAFGAPMNAAPSGFASNPLAVGSQTMVGNMAGYSQGTAVNPFGQVASGRSVLAGPVGIQSGSAFDFSGIPGLSQIGNMIGGRRRRDLSLLMKILSS